MILLELEIEDYKQFQGKHSFTPGANGVVAIIGPNGAGKTTLFEAIEWCLFQPREIRNDEIAPRATPEARPRVRVRLYSPSGPIWEIERSLRKTSATAEIRKITDEGREVVVNGSSAVTDYTATKLIGLEHKAFVATFFTRQKELSFFGSHKPTDRRREVGRLLGLETIRAAQEVIATERAVKRTLANALQGQYDHESGERDFEAERTERVKRVSEIDLLIAGAGVALLDAEQKHSAASGRRSALLDQRDAARQVQIELERQRSVISTADATITAARNSLARLDTLESERPDLLLRASTLAELDQKVAGLEIARERAKQLQSLTEQQQQAQTEVARLIGDAQLELANIPFPKFSPIQISTIDGTNPVSTLNQVLIQASTISSTATDVHANQLRAIMITQAALTEHEASLQKYLDAVTRFERQSADLSAEGDPAVIEGQASERRDSSLKDIAAHRASMRALERSIADYDQLISRPASQAIETICTMCGRPISEHESGRIRQHAEARRNELEAEIARLQSEITRHERTCAEVESLIKELRDRANKLHDLQGRVQNGLQTIETQRNLVDSDRHTLMTHMASMNRTEAVADEELADLQQRLTCERAVEGLATAFSQIRTSLESQLDRSETLATQVAALGVIQFDTADLTSALRARDDASKAIERLLVIDGQATQRPEHNQAIAESEASRTIAQTKAAGLEQLLAESPIDDDAIADLDDELTQLQQEGQRQRAVRENHHRERLTVQNDIRQIDIDQDRLTSVAKRAEEARVAADDLSHMYDEFNEFERFVARRVRPQLEDMTSELVRVVTENKYESVVLDDNYGIEVYDGTLGPYPIEHFSGGERDIVALAARLALSRLIGSQAANPPSFLVLDEVFGSLDRDRRGNLLDLLGSLAGSAESFQQLFVISHVDDVRVSSAFTEVWRIVEQEDGTSRLENLNATQAAEDL